MEVIKRKISFEPATVRYTGGTYPYGTMTADSFYIKVMLTQNMDDMGMYTDIDFIPESQASQDQPNYTILQDKLTAQGIIFPFMLGITPSVGPPIDLTNIRVVGKNLNDYWNYGGGTITGSTDSKIRDVRSYNNTDPYIIGFDINSEIYINYDNVPIDGRTRITEKDILKTPFHGGSQFSATTYVFDTNNDTFIGSPNQTSGLLYRDFTGITRGTVDSYGNPLVIPLTDMQYIGEGWNETNTSLSALTKEEYLFGITQQPEVDSDVFIDRGATIVFEKHLRLSEVESLEHMERYNNGYYNLVKQ